MAIKDANNKYHSESNGRFVSINNMSADDLKGQLQQELPQPQVKVVSPQEELNDLLGEEFKGVKGQAAIDKLMAEKRGHVKGAFHRDDMGDIDVFWGNETVGLQHIFKRREEQGINVQDFMKDISQVIEEGTFQKKNDRGNFEFWHKGKMAVIAPEYHGNKITYLLTAYKQSRKNYKAPQ